MMICLYESKKSLKEHVGKPLMYQETSMFGPEYKDTGSFCVCNHPHMTGYKREFFATVVMKDGLIEKVS